MDKIKIAGIALFCGAIGIGGMTTIVTPQKERSVRENRILETKPDFSAENIFSGNYQDQYEKYLNDQMPLRDEWVRMAIELERMSGKEDANDVYFGKDGYLLEKYGPSDFARAQTEENMEHLASFLNDSLERFGKGRVSCLLLPDKATAMPDKLPEYADDMAEEVKKMTSMVKERLDDPGILPDIVSELQKHQDEYIYYRTDHHWTTLGAYYAYCLWADTTGHVAGKPEDYNRETVFDDFYGTTYNKAPIQVAADLVELFHSKKEHGITVREEGGDLKSDSFYFTKEAAEGFDRYNVFFSKNAARIRISGKAGTGRNLLVVKDSYANCFVPFLAGDYDEIIMLDFRYENENIYDILDEYDEITDILIIYNAVTFMQDTNIHKLDKEAETMEEFDPDSFFDEIDDGI